MSILRSFACSALVLSSALSWGKAVSKDSKTLSELAPKTCTSHRNDTCTAHSLLDATINRYIKNIGTDLSQDDTQEIRLHDRSYQELIGIVQGNAWKTFDDMVQDQEACRRYIGLVLKRINSYVVQYDLPAESWTSSICGTVGSESFDPTAFARTNPMVTGAGIVAGLGMMFMRNNAPMAIGVTGVVITVANIVKNILTQPRAVEGETEHSI